MAFKFVALATLLAVANAGLVPYGYQAAPAHLTYGQYGHYAHGTPLAYAAPVAKAVVTKTVDTEYDPHPEYNFSYNVHDSLTGDAKTQQETRHGDVVEGSYSLVEADGTRRVVHYTADDVNGFNAVVEKQPAAVAVKTVAPVVHAPAYAYKAAPVYHAAPVAYKAAPVYATSYAAPVAHQYTEALYHH
ncbi:larval cuticle protein A2B-like [Microplitis demolitor]|uniref:larval cuticle protein A2B-like n=1 Tax=Microplitis demolitor TaxID=69319 RepID=UPI0004CD91B2|nr:larval cuticle protein A2B-like [Microplitis demolitor]